MRLIKPLAVLTFLLLALTNAGAGRQDDGAAAIKTADGYLLVWNTTGSHFTLAIRGKDVQPKNSSENILFKVGDVFLQIQAVAISNFMKNAGKEKPDDRTVLMAHRDWESEFIQNTVLHKKLDVQTVPQKLKDGREALIWKYDMPELPAELHSTATKQIYLSEVSGNHVILLNGTVEGVNTEAMVQTLLLDTISTLKESATPIDLLELRKTILGQRP